MRWRAMAMLLTAVAATVGGCASEPVVPTGSTAEVPTLSAQLPPALWFAASGPESAAILPVDPLTLRDLPGRQPVDAGADFVYATSPDGGRLALISWKREKSMDGKEGGGDQKGRPGRLRLIDLAAWRETSTAVTIPLTFANDRIDRLFFSPDGTTLYWVKPTHDPSAAGGVGGFALFRCDWTNGKSEEVVRFPGMFYPMSHRFLEGGARLALFGWEQRGQSDGERKGETPRVLLIDLSARRIAGQVVLFGVTAGSWQVSPNEPVFASIQPGIAWDDKAKRLYVVHAEAERVTIVDLAGMKVEREAVLRSRGSAVSRLLDWLWPVAEAKMIQGVRRQAELSPDGSYLYVTGTRSTVDLQPDGKHVWRDISLGLSVYGTSDFREIKRIELPVNRVALSPDGRHLLLEQYEAVGRGSEQERRSGVCLLDVEGWKEVRRLETDDGAVYSLLGFSPDSRYAFAARHLDPGGAVAIQVVDVQTGKIAAERTWYGGWLSYEAVAPLPSP